MSSNWITKDFTEIFPETLTTIIGKPVFIGLYTKETEEEPEKYVGATSGILYTVSYLDQSLTQFFLRPNGNEEDLRYDQQTHTALVTWDVGS